MLSLVKILKRWVNEHSWPESGLETVLAALFSVLRVGVLINSVRIIFLVQVKEKNCSLQHSLWREGQGQIAPSNSLVERTLALSFISTRQGLAVPWQFRRSIK